MPVLWLLFIVAVGYGLVLLLRAVLARRIIHDYQVGLRYRNGRFITELKAGTYWFNPLTSSITIMDKRRTSFVVGGQEITTEDNVGLKVSATVSYEIQDAERAMHRVVHYHSELYTLCQLALRETLSSLSLDTLMASQRDLGEVITARVGPQAKEIGLNVHSIQIRDLMFSNDLKRSFNDVLKAKKEAEAKLERARGESAALRNLANAAKMLDDNPNLLSLRVVQAMEHSQGHEFHLKQLPFGGKALSAQED